MKTIERMTKENMELAKTTDRGNMLWIVTMQEIERKMKLGARYTVTVELDEAEEEYYKLNLSNLENYLTKHAMKALDKYKQGGLDKNKGTTEEEKYLIYIRHALNNDFKNFIDVQKNRMLEGGVFQKDSNGVHYNAFEDTKTLENNNLIQREKEIYDTPTQATRKYGSDAMQDMIDILKARGGMEVLTPLEKELIELRYLTPNPYGRTYLQVDIAEMWTLQKGATVSKSSVNQMEKKALEKLRNYLTTNFSK